MTFDSWDAHYTNDLNLHTEDDKPESPSDLSSWFDDVDAPARTLAFLTSDTFPHSPSYILPNGHSPTQSPSILDLGTGNGSTLFQLRLSGCFTGPMLGVDYSVQSIELARKLAHTYGQACSAITFEVMDIIRDKPQIQRWWPSSSSGSGFDLVLDKGTFDAISLSSETITDPNGTQRRICELYPSKAIQMVKLGGFLLVTSCNWTEDEVVRWFTSSKTGKLEVWGMVKYPKYKFGGQEGQGVASICFRRIR